jgi:uncharacterized protein (DUF1778 family)
MSDEKSRTALLIRCTTEEARAIREAARRERRTLSGFVLNAVMNRITAQHRVEQAITAVRTPPARNRLEK